jgi:thiol-disulfide isomerase/thioredoxin
MSSEGRLPGFDGATGWLNSPPLTAADVEGKVVLVDFWTYTCINWLRTLAYVRAWAEKYDDRGLVTVGVHTPEFPFEHDVDDVRHAAEGMRIEYPVAIDSDYGSGARSATTTGLPCTSPTRADRSGTTNSARVGTKSANGSFSGCCARPGSTASVTLWPPSPPAVSRLKPIGRTWRRPRPTSVRTNSELRVSRWRCVR